jgi:hypothetical protein
MKIGSVCSVAAAAFSVALWISQASAASKDSGVGIRDSAITRCLAQAHGHYPGKYWDSGQDRDFAYRAYMSDAGLPP